MAEAKDKATDQQSDKTIEATAADPTDARSEAEAGLKNLADGTKRYYQARKAGERDKDTGEILGPQPVFVDGGQEKAAATQGSGTRTEGGVDAPQAVNTEKIVRLADALHNERSPKGRALNGLDGVLERSCELLKGTKQAEREALMRVYKDMYGETLEESYSFLDGSRKVQFGSILHKKDRDNPSQNADRVKAALERAHEVFGPSRSMCEKDIRDSLRGMKSDDIQKMDDHYWNTYHLHLGDAIMNDREVSQATKEMCKIYLQGLDKRNDEDSLTLADIALKDKDLDTFKEAMSGASEKAREQFRANGGEQKIKDAFEGHWYNWNQFIGKGSRINVTDRDLDQALAYAKYGKEGTAKQIKDNSGIVNNDESIELALRRMSKEEREAFRRGKELIEGIDESKLSQDDKKALEIYRDPYRAVDGAQLEYCFERGRQLIKQSVDESKLSGEDRMAFQTYTEIHAAIANSDPTNSAKISKWDDMAAHKDGSLVARIESHAGIIVNDSRGQILKEIDKMTPEDWKYAKAHPEYREDVRKALEHQKGLGLRIDKSDIDAAMKRFDEKIAPSSFEASQQVGNRGLLEKLEDDIHWYGNDRKAIIADIASMTQSEQKKYREEPEFRQKVDDAVKKALEGTLVSHESDLLIGRHMLDNVQNGTSPDDLVYKLSVRARNFTGVSSSDKPVAGSTDNLAEAIREIKDEFCKDRERVEQLKKEGKLPPDAPDLHERILHPKTDAEKRLSESFHMTTRGLFSTGTDYDCVVPLYLNYVVPLVETGRLSFDKQMELYKDTGAENNQGVLKDVAGLVQEAAREKEQAQRAAGKDFREKPDGDYGPASREVERLLNPPEHNEYQNKIFGLLSKEDRDVARQVLQNRDGRVHAEDELRMRLNHLGGSSDIVTTLRGLSPAQLDQARSEYARKYGSDLQADLFDKALFGSENQAEMKRLFRHHANTHEAYNAAREDYYGSRDGFGSKFVDGVRSGTGQQLDDAMHQYAREIAEANQKFGGKMPLAKQQELEKHFADAIKNFKASKEAAADYTANAATAATAIAATIATGGADMPMLAVMMGGVGAVTKVATKQAILGADYDSSRAQLIVDILSGAASGATSVIGPGEIAGAFGVGKVAATRAVQTSMQQIGKEVLIEGGERALQEGTETIMKNALAHGAKSLEDKTVKAAIRDLAEKTVSDKLTGTAREKAVQGLTQSLEGTLQESFKKETESWLTNAAREGLLNFGAGGTGGAIAGAVDASARWDGSKSFDENMKMIGDSIAMGAVSGGVGAVGMTGMMKVGGAAWKGIAEHLHVKPGERLSPENMAAVAKSLGHDAHVTQGSDGTLTITEKAESPKSPSSDTRSLSEKPGHTPPAELPKRLDGKAIELSNQYARTNEMTERLPDGWSNAGAGNEFGPDGRLLNSNLERNVVVVDRKNDPVLRSVIAEASERFGHLPPRERADALNDYVNKLLKPEGSSQAQLDSWYDGFMQAHKGERTNLGEYIKEGKGVCSQQAILMKVLGDELGLETTLVRGAADASQNQANHVWTHIQFPNESTPRIYDPLWKEKGLTYEEAVARGEHRRDFETERAKLGARDSIEPAPISRQGSGPTEAELRRLRSELKSGVELDEARDIIEALRQKETPTITVPMEYLEKVLAGGRIEANPTWIGHKLLIGTLGREPLLDGRRFTVRVINPAIEVIPRATGSDNLFHGVVGFNRDSMVIGRDIEIILPDGTVIPTRS